MVAMNQTIENQIQGHMNRIEECEQKRKALQQELLTDTGSSFHQMEGKKRKLKYFSDEIKREQAKIKALRENYQ